MTKKIPVGLLKTFKQMAAKEQAAILARLKRGYSFQNKKTTRRKANRKARKSCNRR